MSEGYFKRADGTFFKSVWWETNSNRHGASGYDHYDVSEAEYYIGRAKELVELAEDKLAFAQGHLKRVLAEYGDNEVMEEESPRASYEPMPVYRNEDKPRLTLDNKGTEIVASINEVKEVRGDSLRKHWQKPMVIITTDKGTFIDYGYNVKKWRKQVGKTITIIIAPCLSVSSRTWAHLPKK